MCINPQYLADGTAIGCRKCWQCKAHKIVDWSGRCIAESLVSTKSSAVTLTYGRELNDAGEQVGSSDHERIAVLTYSDVQKYFKRLRKSGFRFSYLVTGEYGSLKGRAHWHVIFYWRGKVPFHRLYDEFFMEKHWPHGFSFWKPVNPTTVAYNCKYVQKDLDDAEAQGRLSMSKKPPLGYEYFAQRAQRYVDQRLAPQDLRYSFPGVKDKEGELIKFYLHNRSAELFLQEYLIRWRGLPRPFGSHGPCRFTGRPWAYPSSQLVEEYEDKVCGRRETADEVDRAVLNKAHERQLIEGKRRWLKEVEDTEKAIAELQSADTALLQYVDLMSGQFVE